MSIRGIILILIFAVNLGWLPAGTRGNFDGHWWQWKNLSYYVLPSFTLGIGAAAGYLRITRSAMLEVLRQDFIRTARAKGLSETRVIWRHALKAAMVSVIPVLGVQAGFVLSGAVYIEMVFQWPGVGRMLVEAILKRDI